MSDIDSVSQIIKENFDIDEVNSIDKRKAIETDRFGYLSVHYVVKLNHARRQLDENKHFSDLKCEVQIRTILQHAWAAIDHKLRYKNKDEMPPKLRRQLYRISALLETADEQFESLTEEICKLQSQYAESVSKGVFDIPLDIESLNAYMENSEHIKKIMDTVSNIGLTIAPHNPNCKLPEYSHVLPALHLIDIKSISDLDNVIIKISDKINDVFSQINNSWKSNVNDPNLRLVLTRDSLLKIFLLFGIEHDKAIKLIKNSKVGEKLKVAIQKTYRNIYNKDI